MFQKISSRKLLAFLLLAAVQTCFGADSDAETDLLEDVEATTEAPWKPTPLGQVEYTGRDSEDYVILYAKFKAELKITYDTEDSNETATVNVPNTAECSHTENEDCSQITLSCTWVADQEFPSEKWQLQMVYSVKNVPSKTDLCDTNKQDDWDEFDYSVTGITLDYYIQDNYFPNATSNGKMTTSSMSLDLFEVGSGSSYKCESDESETVDDILSITFSDYQSQAFQISSEKEDAEFDTAKTCDADDDGSSLVPIIVGCVLAALIILTLIAYFIGRWHQNRQGAYQAL